jgi:hypothetical protein
MNESTNEMQKLLREIAEHLSVNSKMDARNAVAKAASDCGSRLNFGAHHPVSLV